MRAVGSSGRVASCLSAAVLVANVAFAEAAPPGAPAGTATTAPAAPSPSAQPAPGPAANDGSSGAAERPTGAPVAPPAIAPTAASPELRASTGGGFPPSATAPAVVPQTPSPASPPAAESPEGEAAPRKGRGAELAIEVGGAFEAGAHFPSESELRNVEEAIDASFGAGLWLLPRSSWALGLSVERIGLGKDHYSTDSSGQTLNASYAVDTLWLGGRLFLSEERPAFYVGLALGPALPTVRATGTRAGPDQFTVPPQPFECSATGRVRGAAALSAGVEFDIGDAWSLASEARAVAHFLDSSASALDGCAPGSGTALGGSLRVGISYRFGL